jgi:hypothetical protein
MSELLLHLLHLYITREGKKLGEDVEEELLEGLSCREASTPRNIASLQRKR